MAFTHGMNVVSVRALATRMDAAADHLDQARIGTDGVAAHLSSEWSGPDARAFDASWSQQHRPAMQSLADALRALARMAREQADEQEEASGSGGSGAAASVGGSSLPAGAGAGGEELGYVDRTDSRRGRYGRHRDILDLAAGAAYYENKAADAEDHLIPRGWSEVSAAELGRMGLQRDHFGVYGDPFSATLYRDSTGNYVLAFEGTDPDNALDWLENVAAARAVTVSDVRAVHLAEDVHRVAAAQGASVEFTGHSAGGRQATLAGFATGGSVVTFNPAPLSDLERLTAVVHNADLHMPVITNYVTSNDPLHVINPSPPGQTVMLDPHVHRESEWWFNPKGVLVGHDRSALVDGLDRLAVSEEQWY